jgi:hypothetical protein
MTITKEDLCFRCWEYKKVEYLPETEEWWCAVCLKNYPLIIKNHKEIRRLLFRKESCPACGRKRRLLRRDLIGRRICLSCYEQIMFTGVCPSCQREKVLRHHDESGRRICNTCHANLAGVREIAECSLCHRESVVHFNDGEERKPVCVDCYHREFNLEECGRCHRERPVWARDEAGCAICGDCYRKTRKHKIGICAECHQEKPLKYKTTCANCQRKIYEKQKEKP